MSDSERPLRGRFVSTGQPLFVQFDHDCMDNKPGPGQSTFTCICGRYYALSGCGPGDYWEEKPVKNVESKQIDSWLEVGKLVLKNFQMHERTQYVEFVFLILGIIYFLEAILKNTLEMLHASGVY